jgi:hypothetical protein
MHSKRWAGKRALWLPLTAGLLSACGTAPATSAFRVSIPTLQAPPREIACVTAAAPGTCVVVTRDDWRAVVRELKAACLGAGQTPRECGAE